MLGVAETRKDLARLHDLRDTCRRMALRGEWAELRAMKARTITPETVARLVDQYGTADYRVHLHLTPSSGVPTLDAHAEAWLASIPGREKGTPKVYRRDIARLAAFEVGGARLGAFPWHEIQPHHIQDAKAGALASGLAPNTLRTMLGAWASFFTWAVAREESEAAGQHRPMLRETNPVRRAKAWVKTNATRHRFLAFPEFDRLLSVAPPYMVAQYATLTLCGLRIEEFMVLPPAHVILPTHLHVGPWGTWAPKGYPRVEHGVRDIPIHHARLLPLLEEYRKEWAGSRTFFVNPNTGDPWTYSAFVKHFRRDVAAAGMVYGQRVGGEGQPEGITPHVLRHSLASWLAQADVQLMKIARILGDTEDTVRRHYAHLLPTDIDRTMNRLFSETAL
jgi:integrase